MANPLNVNPLNVPTSATSPAVAPRTVIQPNPLSVISRPFDSTALGIARNTITGIPAAGYKVGKDLAQSTLRSYLSLGDTIKGRILGKTAPQVHEVPKNLQGLLGATEIRDLPTQFNDMKGSIESSNFARKYGLDKFATPLAIGGILGQSLLDYAPLGGSEKSAITALTKETDNGIIKAFLEKSGLHPDIAHRVSPDIAEATNPKEVKTILDMAKGMQVMKNKTINPKTGIHRELTPLLDEARKFSSPEDFTAAMRNKNWLETLKPKEYGVFKDTLKREVQSTQSGDIESFLNNVYDKAHRVTPETRYRTETALPPELDQSLEEARINKEILRDAADDHPGKDLIKYRSSATGELPEVLGQNVSKSGDVDVSQKTLEDYINLRNQSKEADKTYARLRKEATDYEKTAAKKTIPSNSSDTIPESLRSLVPEARKHGSAEEFIAQQGDLLFHGTRRGELPRGDEFVSLSSNKSQASGFAESRILGSEKKSNPEILEVVAPKGKTKEIPFSTGKELESELRKAKTEGYDYASYPEDGIKSSDSQKTIVSLNPSSLRTQSELRDLYTQAAGSAEKKTVPSGINDVQGEPFPSSKSEPGRQASGNYVDPTIEQQIQSRKLSTPAMDIQKVLRGPDEKSWQSLIKGYSRNLPKEKKAHLLDYFGTPEFVLEKLGLQKGAVLLQDAKDLYHKNLKIEIGKIIDWKKRVEGTPDSSRRIFKYLDGNAKDTKPEMTDEEYNVALEIKSYLKDWAKRLDLPEDDQVSNYITHLFERTTEKQGESPFDDPEMRAIMDSSVPKSVYDPFLQKRVNKPGYKQDVWAALDAYTKRATRKEAMDPALEELSKMADGLDDEGFKYVQGLAKRVNMQPSGIDKLVDNFITQTPIGHKFTDRPTAYLTKKIRQVFYRGFLGLNISSALRNLSQGANTYAKLGEKYTVVGYTKLIGKLATNHIDDLYEHGVLDDGAIEDKKVGVYKTTLQKLDPILFGMFETAEKINRGAAFYGAKAKAINKGMSEEEAIKYAKRIVRETQFTFGNVDSPLILSSDIAKTAGQLSSYSVKQIEFLSRMAANKEYGGLLRWAVSSLGFVYTIGKAFGMTPDQLIPSIGLNSPLWTATSGLTQLATAKNTQDKTSAKKELTNLATDAIPAGAQIKKTISGLKAYNAGKDVTATGKSRYTIPHTPGNLTQAALFGKNALPQAQAYYKKFNSSGTPKKKVKTSL